MRESGEAKPKRVHSDHELAKNQELRKGWFLKRNFAKIYTSLGSGVLSAKCVPGCDTGFRRKPLC